jgi:hypothetical protein
MDPGAPSRGARGGDEYGTGPVRGGGAGGGGDGREGRVGGALGDAASPDPPPLEPGTLLAIVCRLAITPFLEDPPMRASPGASAHTMEK